MNDKALELMRANDNKKHMYINDDVKALEALHTFLVNTLDLKDTNVLFYFCRPGVLSTVADLEFDYVFAKEEPTGMKYNHYVKCD